MVAQVFQCPFPVSAVAQGGIGGEVFYIVEAVEIPVRDEPNRQVIIKDDIIMKVAPKIMKTTPYTFFVLCNKDFNDLMEKNYNMVQIKAILHNKVLMDLVKKYNPDYKYPVVDQFVNEKKFYSYLKDDDTTLRGIKFYTKGESKCMSVAAASVIARYIFINEMDKLSKISGFNLHKGAGIEVDNQIKEIIQKKGKDYLYQIGKVSFNNYTKLK